MAKSQFRRGFMQSSKAGKFFVKVIKIGTEKVCLKELFVPKITAPKKPIEPKKELEVKEIK